MLVRTLELLALMPIDGADSARNIRSVINTAVRAHTKRFVLEESCTRCGASKYQTVHAFSKNGEITHEYVPETTDKALTGMSPEMIEKVKRLLREGNGERTILIETTATRKQIRTLERLSR